MAELISLYWKTIVASALVAAVLSGLGMQLAARDRAMQTICISQGSMIGVLLGIAIAFSLELQSAEVVLPFFLALSLSGLTMLFSEKLVATDRASNNTHFAALFVVLLACSYLLSATLPGLESHMSQQYFGDLATASENSLNVLIVFSLLAFVLTLLGFRKVTRESFQLSMFGRPTRHNSLNRLFTLFTLVTLCVCVQWVGLLFTLACLFLPTSFLVRCSWTGLKLQYWGGLCVAVMGATVGFLVSLYSSVIPTVPMIVVAQGFFGLMLIWISNLNSRPGKVSKIVRPNNLQM